MNMNDKPKYRKAKDRRPWKVSASVIEQCKKLFPAWLSQRGGIVIYENHVLDSFALGQTTFMPVLFIAAEDDALHWSPLEHRPDGGLPSRRQQQVDLVELSDYPDTSIESVIETAFSVERRQE